MREQISTGMSNFKLFAYDRSFFFVPRRRQHYVELPRPTRSSDLHVIIKSSRLTTAERKLSYEENVRTPQEKLKKRLRLNAENTLKWKRVILLIRQLVQLLRTMNLVRNKSLHSPQSTDLSRSR